VPSHVRTLLYLFWIGAVAAALGILGFFLSFSEVGSPAQATIDVHREIPVLAYASIAAWLLGMVLMWLTRIRLNAEVAKKQRADRDAMIVDVGALGAPPHAVAEEVPALETPESAVDAPDGREP
jgi:hypothetical protein